MILASTRCVVGRLANGHSMSVMTHSLILSGAGAGTHRGYSLLLLGRCQQASASGSSPARFDAGVEDCFQGASGKRDRLPERFDPKLAEDVALEQSAEDNEPYRPGRSRRVGATLP